MPLKVFIGSWNTTSSLKTQAFPQPVSNPRVCAKQDLMQGGSYNLLLHYNFTMQEDTSSQYPATVEQTTRTKSK